MSTGGFFAIDRRTWLRVCEFGVTPAVSYLVLARGTGPDNATTSWSVNAIETYTGISRPRAEGAIKVLCQDAQVLDVLKSGKRPQYKLKAAHEVPTLLSKAKQKDAKPDLIWLPNSIIGGIKAELPPIELLRQSQNIEALRMFCLLYHVHDLRSNAGVEWRPGGIRLQYKREALFRHGSYVVWGFASECRSTSQNFSLFPKNATDQKKQEFWDLISFLERLGLLEFVEHLVDSDSVYGEILHPLPLARKGEREERRVSEAVERAATSMIESVGYCRASWYDAAVPVQAHVANVQLVGILRHRYRPHTGATKAWLSDSAECNNWAEKYEKLASQASDSTTELSDVAISKKIKGNQR